jgi:molybdopterin biosynthesis enzyme
MDTKVEISVARMEVQVERLEKDVAEVKDDVKAIRATLDKATGGWKVLMMVGGASAAIAALITKVMSAWPFGR